MYRNPTPTADVIVYEDQDVLLVKRGKDPFKGQWALPGGHVDYGETLENAGAREVLEETGMEVEIIALLGVYSDPNRDPRGHYTTAVFIARPISGEPEGGDDASEAAWHNLNSIRLDRMAFDHALVLTDFKDWLRAKDTYWSTKKRT